MAVAVQMVRTFFPQGRSGIAHELVQHRQWRTAHGQLKIRATLAILVAWEQRGYLHFKSSPMRSGKAPRSTAPVVVPEATGLPSR